MHPKKVLISYVSGILVVKGVCVNLNPNLSFLIKQLFPKSVTNLLIGI